MKKKDDTFRTMLENIKNEHEQKINEKIDENENIKNKYVAFKIERDKYFGEFNILKDEYERMKYDFQQQILIMKDTLKEMDDDYKRKINILNENIKFARNQNNQLKNENNDLNIQLRNIKGINNFDEKLVQNGEELYKELIKIKKENEELKKELDKFKQ